MKEINIKGLTMQPFTAFGSDWMALAAGTEEKGYNAMTIAWGHFGSIWERGNHRNCLPTAICFVRPSRYTKEFLDREDFFSLSCFGQDYRKALGYMGVHSGRNENKIAAAGLTPVFSDGTVYFAEADTVYICKKLYHAPLAEEGFVDTDLISFNYPKKDFHEMYIGEVIKTFKKEVPGGDEPE